MIKAILTGFEPFGPYKYNPVQDLALAYDGKRIGDIEIKGLVLPCSYYGAFKVLSSEIDRLSPNIVLSAGLSSSVKCLRLETRGQNVMNGKYADAEGKQPKNISLIENEKWWYATTSDNANLLKLLSKNNLHAELSIDADSFICNSLIYLTSRKITQEKLPISYAFLHTPWTDNYLDKINLEFGKVVIKRSDLERSVEILLNGMANAVRK